MISCLYTTQCIQVNATWKAQFSSQGVGVTKPISSVPLFSEYFRIIKAHVYYWISRLFDRCRRSLAAVAPVKCRYDSNNLRGTFGKSNILLTGKLTNGVIVTPTPGDSSRMGVFLPTSQFAMKTFRVAADSLDTQWLHLDRTELSLPAT